MIVHQKDGWHVLSEKGKNLGGPYSDRSQAVKRLRQVEFFKRREKTSEYAPGIPDRQIKTNPRLFTKPELWKFNVQQHEAKKAGPHFDLRLVDPGSGIAHSWAVRSLPANPGEKVLAVQQPDHTAEYSGWEGKIEAGYGAGTVKLFSSDRIEVTKSAADHITFNVYRSNGDTDRYTLVHTGGNDWLFMNSTPTRKTRPELNISKPKFKSVSPDDIDLSKQTEVLAPKIDGAMNAFLLQRGRPVEVYSYRPSAKGPSKLINHSFRTKLYETVTPDTLRGKTVLLGEVFAKDPNSGQALSSRDTAARLLSNVWRSRELQKDAPLDHVVFDVVRYQGRDVSNKPYREKLEILRAISREMPEIKLPPLAASVNEKQQLLNEVRAGKHPLTQEGVVVYDLDKPVPVKAKLFKDYDVRIRDIFPGEGKYKNVGAGGFTYSYVSDNKVVGRVGSGFNDKLRKQMFEDPRHYTGMVARVIAQEKLPSGALRMPVFKDFRSEAWPRTKQAELQQPSKSIQLATINKTKLTTPKLQKAPAEEIINAEAPVPVLGDSMSGYTPTFAKAAGVLHKLKFKSKRPDIGSIDMRHMQEMRTPPNDPGQMLTEDSIPVLGDNMANMPKTGLWKPKTLFTIVQ